MARERRAEEQRSRLLVALRSLGQWVGAAAVGEVGRQTRLGLSPSSPTLGVLHGRGWVLLDSLCYMVVVDWSSCPAVERDPERVSGTWVFRGTRVPVSVLFENLEDGASVTEFVDWFPGVTIEQARAVLEHAACSALVSA